MNYLKLTVCLTAIPLSILFAIYAVYSHYHNEKTEDE